MAHSYNFAIAQLESNSARRERLNFGIVIFDADHITVHQARNFEKVRSISGALDPSILQQALMNLPKLDHMLLKGGVESIDERRKQLSALSPIKLTDLGTFFAPDAEQYSAKVEQLLIRLVEPEPARPKPAKSKNTRLLTSLKAAFRSEKVLAKKGEGLDSHRIVVNEPLAEGLSADLALKNGAMHIVQTVDASHTDRARKAIQEIGISALVFEQARIRYDEISTKPRLVYSANAQMETAISAALHVAEHQGADLINWDSRDDRTKFIVDLSSLAEPAV